MSLRSPLLFTLFILPLAGALLSGCGGEKNQEAPATIPQRSELLVGAAASLKDAFTELGKELESRDSTIRVTFNFAASNLLARQIAGGAPMDLFASAATEVMDSLETQGLMVPGSRQIFARNSLVVIGGAGADSIAALESLAAPAFQRIAVASPGVPARIYAEKALRGAGVWESIEKRLVFGSNVRQVLDYVMSGEANAGLVYASDAAAFTGRVGIIHRVDPSMHPPIVYPVAIVRASRNRAAAEAFIRLLLDPSGEKILRRHGFIGVGLMD